MAVEPVLIGLAVALVLLERSRHTFASRREFLDVLDPSGKKLKPYLIETVPIFIYSVSVLFCLALYFYCYPNLLSGRAERALGGLLFLGGMVLRRWAIRALGFGWTVRVSLPPGPRSLVTSVGPYKYLRHPYYAGSAVEFLGLLMFLSGWEIAAVIAIIQLVAYAVRARLEERHLSSSFGAEYAAYKERVGGFSPKLLAGRGADGSRAVTAQK